MVGHTDSRFRRTRASPSIRCIRCPVGPTWCPACTHVRVPWTPVATWAERWWAWAFPPIPAKACQDVPPDQRQRADSVTFLGFPGDPMCLQLQECWIFSWNVAKAWTVWNPLPCVCRAWSKPPTAPTCPPSTSDGSCCSDRCAWNGMAPESETVPCRVRAASIAFAVCVGWIFVAMPCGSGLLRWVEAWPGGLFAWCSWSGACHCWTLGIWPCHSQRIARSTRWWIHGLDHWWHVSHALGALFTQRSTGWSHCCPLLGWNPLYLTPLRPRWDCCGGVVHYHQVLGLARDRRSCHWLQFWLEPCDGPPSSWYVSLDCAKPCPCCPCQCGSRSVTYHPMVCWWPDWRRHRWECCCPSPHCKPSSAWPSPWTTGVLRCDQVELDSWAFCHRCQSCPCPAEANSWLRDSENYPGQPRYLVGWWWTSLARWPTASGCTETHMGFAGSLACCRSVEASQSCPAGSMDFFLWKTPHCHHWNCPCWQPLGSFPLDLDCSLHDRFLLGYPWSSTCFPCGSPSKPCNCCRFPDLDCSCCASVFRCPGVLWLVCTQVHRPHVAREDASCQLGWCEEIACSGTFQLCAIFGLLCNCQQAMDLGSWTWAQGLWSPPRFVGRTWSWLCPDQEPSVPFDPSSWPSCCPRCPYFWSTVACSQRCCQQVSPCFPTCPSSGTWAGSSEKGGSRRHEIQTEKATFDPQAKAEPTNGASGLRPCQVDHWWWSVHGTWWHWTLPNPNEGNRAVCPRCCPVHSWRGLSLSQSWSTCFPRFSWPSFVECWWSPTRH